MPKPLVRWTRRRHVAEAMWSNLSDVTEYQPSLKGAEKRLPIFDNDGTLAFVFLPNDSTDKLANTLGTRHWKCTPSWRDSEIQIYVEVK